MVLYQCEFLIEWQFGRVPVVLHVVGDIAEDPWFAQCSAADHDAVACGVFEHSFCIFRAFDIAVADDGDVAVMFQ